MEILRLMGACNNKCKFCMVKGEIEKSTHQDIEAILKTIENMSKHERLDLFGGEPTLYPHFWDILEYASLNKLRISIATNCRSMSDITFTKRLRMFQPIEIRTSLYGHEARTHDYYTGKNRSFQETIQGINNLCKIGMNPLVNIVILEKNVNFLLEMIQLLHENGVHSIKLSSVYGGSEVNDFLIDFNQVRDNIIKALFLMSNMGLSIQIEKTPFCVAPPFINLFIPETDPEMKQSSRRNYTYAAICDSCKIKSACLGILSEYQKKFGEISLQPFESIPLYAIRCVELHAVDEYTPAFTTEFVRVTEDTNLTESEKVDIFQQLKNKYINTFIIEKGEIVI